VWAATVHLTRLGSALTAAVLGAGVALVAATAQARVRGYPPELTATALIALLVVVLGLVLAIRYMRSRLQVTAEARPDPHLAFRLFVLGKASVLGGSAVVGVYLALGAQRLASQHGSADRHQLLLAAAGVVAGLLVAVAGAVLERSCRDPGGPPGPPLPQDESAWAPTVTGGVDGELPRIAVRPTP